MGFHFSPHPGTALPGTENSSGQIPQNKAGRRTFCHLQHDGQLGRELHTTQLLHEGQCPGKGYRGPTPSTPILNSDHPRVLKTFRDTTHAPGNQPSPISSLALKLPPFSTYHAWHRVGGPTTNSSLTTPVCPLWRTDRRSRCLQESLGTPHPQSPPLPAPLLQQRPGRECGGSRVEPSPAFSPGRGARLLGCREVGKNGQSLGQSPGRAGPEGADVET